MRSGRDLGRVFEKLSAPRIRSAVWAGTANGHGSTNDHILRFSTNLVLGSSITYADSSTDGASFTINKDGIYYVGLQAAPTSGAVETDQVGVSVNSSQLTTDINSITSSDRLFSVAEENGAITVTKAHGGFCNLSQGDVLRPHDGGTASTAAYYYMEVVEAPFFYHRSQSIFPDCVSVSTGNGHGSTNTKIRIFTDVWCNTGSAIAYSTSATDGDAFTINQDGVYEMLYIETNNGTGTSEVGISLNSGSLTTDIESLTASERLWATRTRQSGTMFPLVVPLSSGDVVRAHTNATNLLDPAANFTIRRIG